MKANFLYRSDIVRLKREKQSYNINRKAVHMAEEKDEKIIEEAYERAYNYDPTEEELKKKYS